LIIHCLRIGIGLATNAAIRRATRIGFVGFCGAGRFGTLLKPRRLFGETSNLTIMSPNPESKIPKLIFTPTASTVPGIESQTIKFPFSFVNQKNVFNLILEKRTLFFSNLLHENSKENDGIDE
jgi:hypothetical protein